MRLTLIREGSLLYSVRLNLKLIQQHPHRKTQNNICPSVWAVHGPLKLTHEEPSHQASDLGLCQLTSYVSVSDCLSACFSLYTMGGTFRIHHSFHNKTRSIQQPPVRESFLPYAWTPAVGQLCSGAHTARAETSAGPHRGLRLPLPNPAHSFSLSHSQ